MPENKINEASTLSEETSPLTDNPEAKQAPTPGPASSGTLNNVGGLDKPTTSAAGTSEENRKDLDQDVERIMDTINLDCSVSDEGGGGLKSGSGSETSDEPEPTITAFGVGKHKPPTPIPDQGSDDGIELDQSVQLNSELFSVDNMNISVSKDSLSSFKQKTTDTEHEDNEMHRNCRLFPEDIECKITQRNKIRRANTRDPALKLLNEEITSDIQKHKQNIWKEHLDTHWDHRHNTHTLWKTIHGLSNRAPPHTLNTSITFNNKVATTPKHIANCFTKQFTNTVKHATHKTNRHIYRATRNIQGYNITLTTSQVEEAIKQSKNNNSQGPDKLNIRHLKHIDLLGLAFLTCMFKTALNKNIIPHTWKLANIVPIPKPNKDIDKGTSYRPIPLLSVIAKTLEKSLLPYKTANIPNTPMQHGYKTQHSTVTALHTLNNTVAKGFNQMGPPARTL